MSVCAEVSEVMKKVRERAVLHIGVKENQDKAKSILEKQDIVDSVIEGDGHLVVTLRNTDDDYSKLPGVLLENGLGLTLLREEEINLESAFMALTKGTGANF